MVYVISCSLQLNELSATQDSDNTGLCLILYEMHSGDKYTLRAPSLSIRDAWFGRLQELISINKKDPRKRSSSELTDPANRSPSIPRKLPFRRETGKKKHLQVENVLSSPGSTLATEDTEVGFTQSLVVHITFVLLGTARDPIFGVRTNCNGRRGRLTIGTRRGCRISA